MATRPEIRLGAMKLIGDVTELEATATTNATSLRDDLSLVRENGTMVGRILVIRSGAAEGVTRRVLTNDKTTATITFADVGTTIESGTVADLFNFRDQGVTRRMVDSAINDAIREVAPDYLVHATGDSSTFSAISPTITAPASFKGFSGLDVLDPDTSEWVELPIGDLYIDRWARTVTPLTMTRAMSDSQSVRMRGMTHLPVLTDDETDCPVSYAWITQQVAANVLFELARKRNDPATNERWAQFYQDKADERRGSAHSAPMGYYVAFEV
jgi:hypothetical protein